MIAVFAFGRCFSTSAITASMVCPRSTAVPPVRVMRWTTAAGEKRASWVIGSLMLARTSRWSGHRDPVGALGSRAMSRAAAASTWAQPALTVGAILAGSLLLRLWVLDVPGHSGDVRVIARWAENMAERGSIGFYAVDNAIYPAFLYVVWPLGLALDDEALFTAIKALSIPFDVALGALLVWVFARRGQPWLGVGAAALYLFNPGTIVAGPLWGQVDSAGTLAFVAALVASASRR